MAVQSIPMSTRDTARAAVEPDGATEGFADSFGLFAGIVMCTFAIAITMAIVGMSQPGWLGFS